MGAFSFAAWDEADEQVRVIRGAVCQGLDESDFGKRDDALRYIRRALGGDGKCRAFGKGERTNQLGLIVGRNPIAAY